MPIWWRGASEMNRNTLAPAARLLRAVLFSALPLAAGIVIPEQASSGGAPSSPRSASPAAAKLLWAELTPEQQQALAPLASEWDALDVSRKNKWLEIGNRLRTMKPEEQQRIQERMRDWVRLTPEQRRLARENYIRAKKLNSDQKSAQWEQYQQLPEEEKKKLAAETTAKKKVTTLPSPGAQEKQAKPLPPIKAMPKPILEQSVTSKAASQSALQPSPLPDSK